MTFDKTIHLHLEEGRTISSLNKEYQIGSIAIEIMFYVIEYYIVI